MIIMKQKRIYLTKEMKEFLSSYKSWRDVGVDMNKVLAEPNRKYVEDLKRLLGEGTAFGFHV